METSMLTDTFLLKLKQNYIDAFSLFNPDSSFEKEQLDFTTKAGQVEVNVSRGAVFEKVCVSNISATVRIPAAYSGWAYKLFRQTPWCPC
jgi:coproporphyrinogen III oxidase